MVIANTNSMKRIRNVVATMAIEDMYLSKEFVNELLASKIGRKDYKRVYFRDKAIMNKLDGKTTETKSVQKADYDRVVNEYTTE